MIADEQADAGVWTFGRHVTQALISVYAMRMAAVFTLSVSSVALRGRLLPRWVVLLGYVVAVLLLVTGGSNRWVALAFPVWVLLLSVMIFVTPAAGRRPPPP